MKADFPLALATVILLQSCGSNAPPALKEETSIPATTESTQPIAVHDTLAFVELVSANYVDSKDYGKSSDNRTIMIEGRTNFPDATTIHIQISGFVPSTKIEHSSDTYADVVVKDGTFKALLKPWNVPQTVAFRIMKADQSASVLKLFGATGELIRLKEENKGEYPNVCFFKSGMMEVNSELIGSLKSAKPLIYEFQKPGAFKQPYEQTLANYAQAWRDKNWDRMASFTQRTQKLKGSDMSGYYEGMELLGFKIMNAAKSTDGIVQDMYSVKFEAKLIPMIKHKGIETRVLVANVVKEGGHWGVNVTSTFRGMND